ncbi:hypothetical protein TUMSATVNIG1_01520 [Vibrio nigripulchritudo]|uniref:ATP-dependent Lon protease n=1 Tax=Vibrio nigripulchritudo TaxID=28173 RepID=UPI00190C1A14|nr:ATP-dependent Lon protease [Vibrio nigripulchritudo]BCL68215.1 hypothetical protein VNTUMSATTG_01520 [Vibrio nigripulchritudo]BDU29543.1 hypothetical protein TUMSATVNIG1_01520 [Vibrio nigripulchritudo]
MLVNPTSASVPLIAPSVNIQTEQVARDNKVREPVAPPAELNKLSAERRATLEEKRRRRAAWNAEDHPDYELDSDAETEYHEEPVDKLERLFDLIALQTYSARQGKGYTIRFRLPASVLNAAINEGKMAKRRTIIKYHYGHSVAPHTPSEVIAVT